ncbi:hypothetical protein E4U21_006824 [Claviceps maximensis]|nr:hypothetical protein E4U21_006824 [Claviceps maximensis]
MDGEQLATVALNCVVVQAPVQQAGAERARADRWPLPVRSGRLQLSSGQSSAEHSAGSGRLRLSKLKLHCASYTLRHTPRNAPCAYAHFYDNHFVLEYRHYPKQHFTVAFDDDVHGNNSNNIQPGVLAFVALVAVRPDVRPLAHRNATTNTDKQRDYVNNVTTLEHEPLEIDTITSPPNRFSHGLGILVGLISTSVQSLGLTLQRKSHILEDEKGPHDVRRPPYRRRRWQLGMGMFVLANLLGSTIQISTLPLPVLSTLQAAGLVFNSICATLILSEPFTRWSLCGTLLVTTGAVLIAIFGAIPSPAHDLDELLVLLSRKPFLVWMTLQALLVVGLGLAIDLVNSMSSISHSSRFRLARGIIYGLISGDVSAHALLFAKSAVELCIKTIGGNNQFLHWQSWAIVLCLVFLALLQLYYLHRGLKLVSTSVLYPLVFCVYNIIAILDGLIYYDQVSLIPPLHAGLIALGTVILLSGVLALSWRLSDDQHTPGVGQSTLAPGLGLVDDTEGEEESLLGSEAAGEEDDEGDGARSYCTFAPVANGETTPLTLTPTQKKRFRRAERAEIWGELEDQEEPLSPREPSPSSGWPHSATIPGRGRSETTPFLSTGGRSMSGSAMLAGPDPSSDAGPQKSGRRRRKSTGFPGIVARRHLRQPQSSLSGGGGPLNGLLRSIPWLRERRQQRSSISSRSVTEDGIITRQLRSNSRDGTCQPMRSTDNDSAV